MDPTLYLDKLVAANELTPGGREWVIAALDPYHDFKVKPAGFPDLSGTDTVVLCINSSMTIQKPAGVSSGTWDCHIFNLQNVANMHLQALEFDPVTGETHTGTGGLATIKDFGFINAVAVQSGDETLPRSETVNLADWASGVTVSKMSPELPPGAGRVIAAGFEVTNTTSNLYQQGSMRAYRISGSTVVTEAFSDTYTLRTDVQSGPVIGTPDAIGDISYYGPGSNLASGQGGNATVQPPRRLVERGIMPPGSLEDAANIPSSIQWHAKEGGYSVISFNDLDNKLEVPSNHGLMLVTSDQADRERCLISTQAQAGETTSLMHQAKPTFIQPLNISGQYYTGLSLETTLVVTSRVYYEFAPAPGNAFMALAGPGCQMDDNAFRLYSAVMRQLPFCTPVKNNSFGSFFKSIGNAIKGIFTGKVVSGIGRAIAPGADRVWDTMDKVGNVMAKRPATAQSNANKGIVKR